MEDGQACVSLARKNKEINASRSGIASSLSAGLLSSEANRLLDERWKGTRRRDVGGGLEDKLDDIA